MSLKESQIPPVSWSATPFEAAWFVFQHMGDGEFESDDFFWSAVGDAVERIHDTGGQLPFQFNTRACARCAVREGWLSKHPDGSLTLKLKTPSWELEAQEVA